MGRPPIGKQAMTSTERSRRRRARLHADQPATKPSDHATKPSGSARGDDSAEIAMLQAALAQASKRIAELEAERVTKPPPEAQAEIAMLQAELAQAKQRIAELEADRNQPRENATLKAENATLKAEVARLKAAAADTQQRQPPPLPRTVADLLARKAQVTAAKKAKRAEAKAARLMAAAAERPDADVPTLLEENDGLKQQLKAARTRIAHLQAEVRQVGQSFDQARQKQYMPRELKRVIRSLIHPERFTDPDERRRYEKLSQEFNQLFPDDRRK